MSALDWEEQQVARAAREPARRAYAPSVGLLAAIICLRATAFLWLWAAPWLADRLASWR
jgi:hypothetical protein